MRWCLCDGGKASKKVQHKMIVDVLLGPIWPLGSANWCSLTQVSGFTDFSWTAHPQIFTLTPWNSLTAKLWPSTCCSRFFSGTKSYISYPKNVFFFGFCVGRQKDCTTPQQLQQDDYLIQRELAVSQWGQGDLMGAHQTKITGATGVESRGSGGCRMKKGCAWPLEVLILSILHLKRPHD